MKQILNIGDNQIIYVAGNKRGKTIVAKQVEMVALEADTYEEKKKALAYLEQRHRLKRKKVEVVLSSKNTLLRELYVPNARSKKQQQELVYNEMLYFHSNLKEYALQYLSNGRVNDENLHGFIAYGVNHTVMDETLDLLEEFQINVSGVRLQADCVARAVSQLQGTTKMILFVEINHSHSELYLIDKGHTVFTRRLNFKYESFAGNTQILAEELAEHINKVMQFQRTRSIDESIHDVVLGGDVETLPDLMPLINAELEALRPGEATLCMLPIEQLLRVPAEDNSHGYLAAAGALLPQEMNFLKTVSTQEQSGLHLNGVRNRALIFMGGYIFVLVALPLAIGTFHQHQLATKTEAITVMATDTDQATEYRRLLALQQQYTTLKAENDATDSKQAAIQALPQMRVEVYQAMASAMGNGVRPISITFSAYDGILTADFEGPDESSAVSYIEQLRNDNYFADVSYQGWEWEAETQAATTGSGLEFSPYESAPSVDSERYYFTVTYVLRGAESVDTF